MELIHKDNLALEYLKENKNSCFLLMHLECLHLVVPWRFRKGVAVEGK